MMEIFGDNKAELLEFFSYIIKIIEGLIIKHHIKLGYFPIHGGLITKEGKGYLILGNSQSGKTTFMNYLDKKNYTLLSDDIVFLDMNGKSYPFGHYKKIINFENSFNENFVENISGIKREIVKLEKVFLNNFTVDEIFILKIVKKENHSIEDKQDDINFIFNLISEYPNEYFIKCEYEYCRALQIINKIIKGRVRSISLAWNKDYEGVEKLWEIKAQES